MLARFTGSNVRGNQQQVHCIVGCTMQSGRREGCVNVWLDWQSKHFFPHHKVI